MFPNMLHSDSSQPTGERMKNNSTAYLEIGIPYESIWEPVKMEHRIQVTVGGFGGYQATGRIRYTTSRKDVIKETHLQMRCILIVIFPIGFDFSTTNANAAYSTMDCKQYMATLKTCRSSGDRPA